MTGPLLEITNLKRWRDVGDGPATYTAGSKQFADDVIVLLREFEALNGSAQQPAPAAWRYEIQHGPDGEANYAWVYDGDNNMVCTAKTPHARMIVAALAASQQSPRLEREALIEECAKIAADRAVRLRAKAKAQTSPSKQSYFAQSIEARVIADAILALLSPDTTVVSSTNRVAPSDQEVAQRFADSLFSQGKIEVSWDGMSDEEKGAYVLAASTVVPSKDRGGA